MLLLRWDSKIPTPGATIFPSVGRQEITFMITGDVERENDIVGNNHNAVDGDTATFKQHKQR